LSTRSIQHQSHVEFRFNYQLTARKSLVVPVSIFDVPGRGHRLGPCHGLDGPLLTGNFSAQLGPMLLGEQPTADAHALSAYLGTTWTGFAPPAILADPPTTRSDAWSSCWTAPVLPGRIP
jgi:hypothetical protein